jgi:hypothetical protein
MESRNSSVRRFSARYTVQWDYAGDYKKLFSSPVRNMPDSKRSKEDVATDIIPESRSLQFMQIEVGNSCEQIRMIYQFINPCPTF